MPVAPSPAPAADAPGPAHAPAITPRQAWWLAIRPRTLPAAVAPVLVGLGASLGLGVPFRPDTAVAALAVALLLQIVANLANDLSDFKKGADTPDRQGPLRVAAAGLITPRDLQRAIALVIGAAGLVGLYLVWVGGVVLLVVGALAIVAALAYTGGPLPYGYKGLGEVFVFLFFGVVAVVGTGYLQSLTFEPLYLWASIPMGCLITAILVVNNLRDIPTDRRANKRTLAVILGERFAKAEYVVLLGVAALVPVVLVWGGATFPVLLPLFGMWRTKPLTDIVLAVSATSDRRILNRVLKGTAELALLFGVLFAIGLALGAA